MPITFADCAVLPEAWAKYAAGKASGMVEIKGCKLHLPALYLPFLSYCQTSFERVNK
jgi:hypothetical protein